MRFSTLPQILAYYAAPHYGRAGEGKADIIGAFFESNSLADIYRATVDAGVVRPEHHLAMSFLAEDARGPAYADTDRASLVAALAERGHLPGHSGNWDVVGTRVPLRGLPPVTGGTGSEYADLLLWRDGGVGVGYVPPESIPPVVALVAVLHGLAHLNKPRVREALGAELESGGKPLRPDAPSAAFLVAPAAWWNQAAEGEPRRRSGWTNAEVFHLASEQLADVGVEVVALGVDGDWRRGFFTLSAAPYPTPHEEPSEESEDEQGAGD